MTLSIAVAGILIISVIYLFFYFPDLVVTVKTEKYSYSPDEDVEIIISIHNPSRETIDLTFRNAPGISLEIKYRSNGSIAFAGIPVLYVMVYETLQPGDTIYRNYTWIQIDNFGNKAITPNIFTIKVGFHSIPELPDRTSTFKIE